MDTRLGRCDDGLDVLERGWAEAVKAGPVPGWDEHAVGRQDVGVGIESARVCEPLYLQHAAGVGPRDALGLGAGAGPAAELGGEGGEHA
jgi:hypothetical protein